MASILFIHKRHDVYETLIPAINGHVFAHSPSMESALQNLRKAAYDVIAFDIDNTPDVHTAIQKLSNSQNKPHILALTGNCEPKVLEQALRAGAWDVLCTPFTFEDFGQAVKRCLHHRDAQKNVSHHKNIKRDSILGTSTLLNQCLENIATIAPSNVNVLLLGETGTGKDLFASAIHANSTRASQNFVVVDCTNIPKNLAESLLFGHERGSFTGAEDSRDGFFKQADGGTIFLDEIGDLDIEVQKSLLRVLQNRKYRPLSSKKEFSSNFRLIAATNKNLEAMVEAGTFRKDLYYRICSSVIHMPPLRERKEDIQSIANYHIRQICLELQCPEKEISYELHHALTLYDWPGNIRELINILHATVHNAIRENRLYPQHLPLDIRTQILLKQRCTPVPLMENSGLCPKNETTSNSKTPESVVIMGPPAPKTASQRQRKFSSDSAEPSPILFPLSSTDLPPLRTVREEAVYHLEAEYLKKLIECSQGDFRQAQEISDLSRARLYDLLNKHNMSINTGKKSYP